MCSTSSESAIKSLRSIPASDPSSWRSRARTSRRVSISSTNRRTRARGVTRIPFCSRPRAPQILPGASVVGIDPWGPSLALAHSNIADAGVEGRVTLVDALVQEFEDDVGFDVAWLPSFFIPEPVLEPAVRRLRELLRPGGRIVVGVAFADQSDRLVAATDDLMTVRSGRSVIDAAGAADLLQRAGFGDVREIERDWNPPLRFVVGTRA